MSPAVEPLPPFADMTGFSAPLACAPIITGTAGPLLRRIAARVSVAWLLLGIFQVAVAAEPSTVKRVAAPAWVEAFTPDLSLQTDPASATGEGIKILLRDEQVHAGEQTTFRHFALRFLSQDGVQNHSTLSFTFDPAYESLSLHELILHRNGKTSDRLAKQEIKLLQREPNLENQLYDGRLSATLILEDIRVGDVVEYAYSLRGANPILAGHFVSSFPAEWQASLPQWRERLLWPSARHAPDIQNHLVKCTPQVRPLSARLTEYRWQADNLPAHPYENETPSWVDTCGWVQISDFASWNEVARWAYKLFALATPGARQPLPEELQRIVEDIRRTPDRAAQVIAALRYVQDNYRYLGIEIGENSHQPYSIATVCERRFGDCKDKANLLSTLLRRLGFEADPALVETEYRHAVGDWHPTPFAFNHAVVRLRLEGTTYWLDATREHQGGTLGHVYFPAYGKALVVREDKQGLEDISPGGFADAGAEIENVYRQEHYSDPASLAVRSVLRGYNADRVRSYFANTDREKIERDYLNFYARQHPKIRPAAKIDFADERDKNEIVINEHYEVAGFWGKDDEPSSRKVNAAFHPTELKHCFDVPTTRLRTMPFGISFPERMTQTIRIVLPGKSDIKPEHAEVRDKAFEFSFDSKLGSNPDSVVLTYRYAALTNVVEADRTPEYLAHIDRAQDQLGYQMNITRKMLEAHSSTVKSAPAANRASESNQTAGSPKTEQTSLNGPSVQPGSIILWLLPVICVFIGIQHLRRIRFANVARQGLPPPLPLHRCAVCGRTEQNHPELDFRVGLDGQDYCTDHSGVSMSGVSGSKA